MLHPETARAKGQTLKLGSQVVAEFAPEHFPGRPPALLGTPRATEYKGTGPVGSPSHEDWLRKRYLTAQAQEITKTLPTPKAGDSYLGTPSTSGRPVEKSTHLSTIVALQSWLLEHRRAPSEKLLPTPSTSEMNGVTDGKNRKGGPTLRKAIHSPAGSTGEPTNPQFDVGSLL